MTKLKLTLLLLGVIIAILSIVLLYINNWSFNVYVAIGIATVLTAIIILLCVKNPSFSLAFCSLFFGGIIYLYGIGWLAIYTCAEVISVNVDKTRNERYYLPLHQPHIGRNQLRLQGGHRYLVNGTHKTLYFTKIAYGEQESVSDNISSIMIDDAKDITNEGSLSWFISPSEKIRVARSIKGTYITYVDFQSY